MPLWVWALWGLAGAFGYAAPRLLTSIFEPPGGLRRPWKAVADFALALSFGPITAAAIGQYLVGSMGLHNTIAEARALAVMIGLLVNPVAPTAVSLMTDFVLARIGHPLARKKKVRAL